MDQSQKKSLVVKMKALGRTFKQYKIYKQEVESFDLNAVSQDKKKEEFYKESTSALTSVKKNLVDYVLQVESLLNQNKEAIEQITDPNITAEIEKCKQNIQQARNLLPADL